MKTVFALACVFLSLHTFSALAETPAPIVEDEPGYITTTELAGQRTAAYPDVPAILPNDNPFAVDPDVDESIIVPSAAPEMREESTGTIPEAWLIETE